MQKILNVTFPGNKRVDVESDVVGGRLALVPDRRSRSSFFFHLWLPAQESMRSSSATPEILTHQKCL